MLIKNIFYATNILKLLFLMFLILNNVFNTLIRLFCNTFTVPSYLHMKLICKLKIDLKVHHEIIFHEECVFNQYSSV